MHCGACKSQGHLMRTHAYNALEALFTAAIFISNCRVNTGVINKINYDPVPLGPGLCYCPCWLTGMAVSHDKLNRT